MRRGCRFAEIDVEFLEHERRRMNTFGTPASPFYTVDFDLQMADIALERQVDPMPFVPSDAALRAARCEEILDIQAHGLATRLRHIRCERAVIADLRRTGQHACAAGDGARVRHLSV